MKILNNLNVTFFLNVKLIFVAVCGLFLSAPIFSAPGRLDYSFQNNLASGSNVRALEIQSDGKVLIAGNIAVRGGVLQENIIRLDADGSLDSAFNFGETLSGGNTYRFIKLQPSGKIIVATGFGNVFRLNTNGSRDATFALTGFNVAGIRDLEIQTDGKILVSGNNLIGTGFITRFNVDGSHDTSFASIFGGGNGNVAFAPQERKIYFFRRVSNGTSHLSRLNLDGTVDASFTAPTVTSTQFDPNVDAEPLSDGRVVIWGQFNSVNGTTRFNLAILNGGGGLDSSFNPPTNFDEPILSVAAQTNGKIIVGGNDSGGNTFFRGYAVRLNADGTVDPTFKTGKRANGEIRALKIRGNNRLLIGGLFYRYHVFPRRSLAQIGL